MRTFIGSVEKTLKQPFFYLFFMGMDMSIIYLDTSSCCDNICPCYIFVVKRTLKYQETVDKIVLLNALVPSSTASSIIVSIPITLDEAKTIIGKAKAIESYIGHESTAKLLSELFGVSIPVSRAMYVPRDGDLAIIVRLKKRLEKPEDVKNVKSEDIEFLLVRYYTNVEVVEYK